MRDTDVRTPKQARKVLAEFSYEPGRIERGYAGRTLYVNLSDNTIRSKPLTRQMKDVFIGGRGFGLKLLWDAVSPATRWDDPENEIIIASGPLGGTIGYPGAGKSLVVSLSPLTDCVMDSNVGGYYGPLLKFSGWDAIEIQMGHGRRADDRIPYRSAGPVTAEEYESRQDRYDKQLREVVGADPEGKSTAEKVAALRAYREEQYEKLSDAAYQRRGWTRDGVPTLEKLRELGIDFPEVVDVVRPYLS